MAGGNLTPRQKMINMMYLVLTAMLALNVSAEVLLGYALVNDSLLLTNSTKEKQNSNLLEELEFQAKKNPQKAGPVYDLAKQVATSTDSLLNFVQELKVAIVKGADGPEGDVDDLQKKDNTEAVSQVMTAPVGGRAEDLRKAIDAYKNKMVALVQDTTRSSLIQKWLNTDPKSMRNRTSAGASSWEQIMFGEIPAATGVALLTKIQTDLHLVETEVLSYLIKSIDMGDFRVNTIRAYMIPSSTNIIRGGKYSAQIVLSAEDSTKRPNYFVGSNLLDPKKKGIYEVMCPSTGEFNIKGFIEMERGDGSLSKYPFEQSYTVVEPSATVSATLMNVLYAKYDNPLSISVPGVPANKVNATVSNGTIAKTGTGFNVRPNAEGVCNVVVSAEIEGKMQQISASEFRVRRLPDPEPYIVSGSDKIKNKISRGVMIAADQLGAGIYDGLLNVPFQVISFNVRQFAGGGRFQDIPSNGTNFSQEQKDYIKSLSRGGSFVIKNLKVSGPYGQQTLDKGFEITID